MNEINSKKENNFKSGAKLNFQSYSDLILTNKDLTLMHLISSSIVNGYFKGTCFYNASFLSTKFSGVTFEKCNLTSTDICSIWARNCKFQKTDFSDSTISDSTFIDCSFNSSTFKNVTLTNCQFVNCLFEQMPLDNSTVSLNTFTQCTIKHTHFTESFYYQIFNNCIFEDINIPYNLLGFNFGFPKEILQHLNKKINLQEIEIKYVNSGLLINAAIFRINQVQENYDAAIVACIAALDQMIQRDILIKADEVRFLKQLTLYFQDRNQISPISIIRIWQVLNNIIISKEYNTAIDNALPYIREYVNMLYFSFQKFLEELQNKLNKLPQNFCSADTVELKIIYNEQPSFPLLTFLLQISEQITPSSPIPRLIRVEKGSFIEFHEIATNIIPYVQTFFSLLGFITPIALYYQQKRDYEEDASKEKNVNTTEVTKIIEINISTAETASKIFLPNGTMITPTTNNIVADTTKILIQQQIIDKVGFSGYNPQNIQSITIHFK